MPRTPAAPAFTRWLPLARQIARRTLRLTERDVLELYVYPPAIPLAEAIALEARRLGSDTHMTLMSDDFWFASMEFLPTRWLEGVSPADHALSAVGTAFVYVGGLGDAARLQRIPAARLAANGVGGSKADKMRRRPGVRELSLPVGWVSPQRAAAYDLNYARLRRGFEQALGADLKAISRAGARWARRFADPRDVHLLGDGTDLRFRTVGEPYVEDGMLDDADIARGVTQTELPAGRTVVGVKAGSASGVVQLRGPVYDRGFAIHDVRLVVERGRVVSWSSRTQRKRLDAKLAAVPPTQRRIGWFGIGLNPLAPRTLMDNGIVEGVFSVGVGAHPALSGRGGMTYGSVSGALGEVEMAIGTR